MERKWIVYLLKLLLSMYFDVVLASNYALSSSFQESNISITGLKSSTEKKSDFPLEIRSGSYSDKGPKQYMEDEFICIDSLSECDGLGANLPSPAAFYGVCFLC